MKRIAFINPYFGKLPKSFPVFLKTCKTNPEVDWIFFTDDKTEYDWPQNVKKIEMEFSELQKLVRSKFDFEVVLDQPYKLCDFKPAYGYIFEEYIDGYDFWGHCDIDTIMGDLKKFLTEDFLNSYDKIFTLGHMILYRNTPENNRVFMCDVKGEKYYKESFSTTKITKFDETFGGTRNINTIFVENGKRVFMDDWSENFLLLPTRFTRTKFNPKDYSYDIDKYKDVLYVWNDGSIKKYYLNGSELVEEDVMYMHFQEREMKFKNNVLTAKQFYVVPNRYIKNDTCVWDKDSFCKINKNPICFHFIEFKYKRLKKKIRNIKVRSAGH